MVGRLTVLIALLAHGVASMSPSCFVRCVAPSGQVCVELVGDDCHGCEHSLIDHRQAETVRCSGHVESDDQAESETRIASHDRCGCSHSPLDFGPQSRAKPLTYERVMASPAIWLAVLPISSASYSALDRASIRAPQVDLRGSLHLTVLATVVLRA